MAAFTSPYDGSDDPRWLRGNVHTHTTVSDGECSPSEMIAEYEAAGYDFLAISDHDAVFDPGDYRDGTDLLLLGGAEVSARDGHVLHVGARDAIEPGKHAQTVLDEISRGAGFGVLAHPNWYATYDHWPQDRLERLRGYAGIEVFNGSVVAGRGNPHALDRWDRLLGDGVRAWGYSTDDAHAADRTRQGWDAVQVTERTSEAVLAALRAGRSYGSTGVRIEDVTLDDASLTVATRDAQRIRLVADYGRVLRSVDGATATFDLGTDGPIDGVDETTYVRVDCFGVGDDRAWTQPFFRRSS
jgi:hypothetical protein